MKVYEKKIEVRWSDVDQNRYVRHSAYYDYGAHTRVLYLTEVGFGPRKFEELRIGPILFKEECSFIREIKPDEIITINMLMGDKSADGSRWKFHHEIFNAAGEKAAHLTVHGAWMDLAKRKLTIPPTELVAAFNDLQAGSDYDHRAQKS